VPKNTWISSFPPMTWSPSRADLTLARYSMAFNKDTTLSAKRVWGTPKRGWNEKHHTGPYCNHTCCSVHVNCCYVPNDEAETYNIRTLKDLPANAECLVNYLTGEDTPHSVTFQKRFGTPCQCCACTQRFHECQMHP
jgi:hypothetical protein